MNEIDPILFGRLLERMDNQDEMLEKVLAEMKCLKTDVHSLKSHAHITNERKERHEKVLTYFWTFGGFLLGNLIQIWIFRGPGAH